MNSARDFTAESVISSQDSRNNSSLVTVAENIHALAQRSEQWETDNNIPHIVSSAFRGALRIMSASLDQNVVLSGEATLLGDAIVEDYDKALYVLDSLVPSDEDMQTLRRFYKFYIEHTEVDGQEVVICSCVPRGHKGLKNFELSDEDVPTIEEQKHRRHYFSSEEVKDLMEFVNLDQVSTVREPLYIVQGFPSDRLHVKQEVESVTAPSAGTSKFEGNWIIWTRTTHNAGILAHEYQHTKQQEWLYIDDYATHLMVVEGEANATELLFAPDKFRLRFLSENIRTFIQEVQEGLKNNSIHVPGLIRAVSDVTSDIPIELRYYGASILGTVLAEEVSKRYGRKAWHELAQVLRNLSNNEYMEFWQHGSMAITLSTESITSAECSGLIAYGMLHYGEL